MSYLQSVPDGPARHTLPPPLIQDLRTPLNQIIGYSEMLVEQARDGGPVNLVSDLERVRAAGRQMLGIIEDNFTTTDAPTPTPPLSPFPAAEAPASRGAEGCLLVVDDDAGNRDVLSRRLEKLGYTVANAENGRQALEMLAGDPTKASNYELVLLDVMMPELDGFEVLRQMKASEALRHTPVIMISALSDMDSVARCIEMGAEDYLPKPFNAVLLKARVSACLEKKRSWDREAQLFEELTGNLKRLLDLEQVRDDLTHMIVHDLRTPLTAVMVAMQTLDVVGDVNPAQREVISIAIQGAESLLGKINELLDVEKLESGAMKLDYSLVSLPELIQGSVAQIAPLAKAKRLDLVQKIAPDLPWLLCDESKVQRILINLLGNAIKFTAPEGAVTIEVEAKRETQCIEFCVRDTGEGIPAEAHQRIFEKFGQVDSRAGGHQIGTGLGLTFCKLAVEAHGGKISVSSAPELGSLFCFSIPLSNPPKPEPAA